ncbi:MAG: VOC family protein [Pseudomonadota bacterium]
MAKVTGIGGVFFLANDDDRALANWYRDCLGFELNDFGGSIFQWQDDKAEDKGMTVWHVAEKDSEWFHPSQARFMVNYRVDDMDGIVERLKDNGVELHQGPESHENGRFLWVIDPEGNKVELWEPKNWDEKNKAQ